MTHDLTLTEQQLVRLARQQADATFLTLVAPLCRDRGWAEVRFDRDPATDTWSATTP